MKLAFLLLLLLNLALYAWQQGVFGRFAEPGREPGRLAMQIEPERFRALSEKEVAVLRERAGPARAAAESAQACVEFGDFSASDVGRAESALGALGLGARQTARAVELPGWYQIYLPPFKTRAEADRRVTELRALDVREIQVIGEGPLRFGLSLGWLRSQDAARAQASALEKRGVKGVRVADQPAAVSVTRFQVRDVDAALAQQLAAIQKEFPAQSIRPCPAN